MSTVPVEAVYTISANAEFKARYPIYIRWAILVALLITALIWAFFPEIKITPYKLRQEEFEMVEIEEQEVVDIPPPPKEAPPPPKVIEAAPDDEVTDEVEIADTLMDIDAAITGSLPSFNDGVGDKFVASSQNPKILHWEKPKYPEIARKAQMEGTVLVKVLVGPDGKVKDAQIIQGVNQILNKAALQAARKCTFIPGKQRDFPVRAWMALPFNFRLH